MPNYVWLDFENRIWLGMIIKEIAKSASAIKSFVTSSLDKEWLVMELFSKDFGYVKKQTTIVNDSEEIFKLLSYMFATLNYKGVQKYTLKLVNRFIFELGSKSNHFSQSYCISFLTSEKPIPYLSSIATQIEEKEKTIGGATCRKEY